MSESACKQLDVDIDVAAAISGNSHTVSTANRVWAAEVTLYFG